MKKQKNEIGPKLGNYGGGEIALPIPLYWPHIGRQNRGSFAPYMQSGHVLRDPELGMLGAKANYGQEQHIHPKRGTTGE